jgi:hypothetical protein
MVSHPTDLLWLAGVVAEASIETGHGNEEA